MPKEFAGHVTFNFSNDGMVYIADRVANRIQVTDKQGNYQGKEFIIAPYTGIGGATGGVAFSPDKEQRYLFISDLTNNHVWFLNRADGKVVGTLGSMGEKRRPVLRPAHDRDRLARQRSIRARCSPANACSASCRPTARAAACSISSRGRI